MSRKWFFPGTFIIFLIGMAVLVGRTVSPALAQCGDNPADSSCITCHEYQGVDPVYGEGEWHEIHALKDCCWSCHGGNTQAQEKDLAHIGMIVQPLQDVYTDCYSCHPEDYLERAERFAAVLGITPGSVPTPTAIAEAQVVSHPIIILKPASSTSASFPWPVAVMGASILGLLLIGFIFVVRLKAPEN